MDGINYIEDHFETTVKPRILEQYKESGRWQACLEAVVRKLQTVEDTAFSISKAIDFKTETPTGSKLDWVAGLINVKRYSGESDEAFFMRFESMCGANTAGTPNNVIYNAAMLSGDPKPAYIDEADATFFVYTGAKRVESDERQPTYTLLLNWVENIGPTPSHGSSIATSYELGMDGGSEWTDISSNSYETDYFASKVEGDPLIDTRSPIDFSGYGISNGTPFVEMKKVYDWTAYPSYAITMPSDVVFTLETWYAASQYELTRGDAISLLYLEGENSRLNLLVVPVENRIYLQMYDYHIESFTLADTNYHHYAITCDGTDLRVFVDGTAVMTVTLEDYDKVQLALATSFVFYQMYMGPALGRFAQTALCNKCKWTANFTPPTTAYTAEAEPIMVWEEGGRQLSRAQVRKMAPAGVLGLPGAAILDAQGNYLTDAQGRLLLAVADDSTIERDVLLADNNGAIVVTSQSVPVRVVLRGPSVPSIPTITTEWNGVPVDAVRIKDLPNAEYDSAYMVRDSDVGGTTKIDESEVGIQMKPSGTNTLKFYRRGPTAESDTEG